MASLLANQQRSAWVRWLLVIFIAALFLRGCRLGAKSLWFDEAFSVQVSQRSEMSGLAFVDRFNPPLYFTTLHYWTSLFGTSEAAARAPSTIFSLINLALLFLLGRKIVNSDVALLAVLLLAISPLDLWYAQEARMYTMVTMSGLLVALGLLSQGWVRGVLIFIGLGLGLYIDYLMIPLWLGLSALWLSYWWRNRRQIKPLLIWLLASGCAWWLYRPWWSHLRNLLDGQLNGVHILVQLRRVLGLPELTLGHLLFTLLLLALTITLAAYALNGLFLRRPKLRRLFAVIVLATFAISLVLLPIPRLYSVKRIVVTGWPYVALLAAWAVATVAKNRKSITYGLATLSLVSSLIVLFLVPKDDWRGATKHIDEALTDQEIVWLDPTWNAMAHNYYRPHDPSQTGTLKKLAELSDQSSGIWLIAQRFPGEAIPSSPSESWLDRSWQIVDAVPFYRLELRYYQPHQ